VLMFTPAVVAFGNSTCNATLTDSEGASSAPQQFTVELMSGRCQTYQGPHCNSVRSRNCISNCIAHRVWLRYMVLCVKHDGQILQQHLWCASC
jgi:hypothetical protein